MYETRERYSRNSATASRFDAVRFATSSFNVNAGLSASACLIAGVSMEPAGLPST